MTDEAWNADFVRCLGVLLNGSAIEELDERGNLITGDTLLVLVNGHSDSVWFTLPRLDDKHQWRRVADTFEPAVVGDEFFKPGSSYPLQARAVALFRVSPPLRDRRRATDAELAAAGADASSALVPVER
jgi:glycogen operon protein